MTLNSKGKPRKNGKTTNYLERIRQLYTNIGNNEPSFYNPSTIRKNLQKIKKTEEMLELIYKFEREKNKSSKESIHKQILYLQKELGLTSVLNTNNDTNDTNATKYVSKRKTGKQSKRLFKPITQNTHNLPFVNGINPKKHLKNSLLIAGIPIGSLENKKISKRTKRASNGSVARLKRLRKKRNEEMMTNDKFNWKLESLPSNIGPQIKRAN
jgi:hypothetical protein